MIFSLYAGNILFYIKFKQELDKNKEEFRY